MMTHPAPSTPYSGLRILNLRIDLQASDRIHLPSFSGSSFRGLLGWSLQTVACSNRPLCRQCVHPKTCLYSYLFETARGDAPAPNHGSEEVPRPFVIEPPFGGRSLAAGERFRLGLRLFGEATASLPALLQAIEEMGERGLGQQQGRFRMLGAAWIGPDLRTRRFLDQGELLEEPIAWDLSEWTEGTAAARRVEVRFVTPTRLVSRGQVLRSVELHHLVRALLRRLHLLRTVHGEGPLEVDFAGLVRLAEGVELERSQLEWFDWQRHSSRQSRSLEMGGLVGASVYRGELGPLLPLLSAGPLLHVGKATTFGMGGLEVRALPGG